MTPEQKKAIEDESVKYGHPSLFTIGANFGFYLRDKELSQLRFERDEEVDRLKEENDRLIDTYDAIGKDYQDALNQLDTLKKQVEYWKNSTSVIEEQQKQINDLKKQVEEMKEVMARAKGALEYTGIKWDAIVKSINELATYITDKQ